MLDPTVLRLVGKPVSTGGDFPVSVAVSPRTGQVCVLNGGTLDPKSVNGVKYEFKTVYLKNLNIDLYLKMNSCYKQDENEGLVEIPDTNRSLNQTIMFSPIGLLNAPSQVKWSEDGEVLYAVVKGSPGTDPGFIASWIVDIRTGALSKNFTKSFSPVNGGLLFSMTPVGGTTGYLVTDVIIGMDIFDFRNASGVGLSAGFPIPNQEAACWGRASKKTGNIYIGVSDEFLGVIFVIP